MRTAFLVLMLLAGCVSGTGASGNHVEGWGFRARVPAGVTVEREGGEPLDFEVYRFLDQERKVLLSVYAGNHPDCPQLDLGFNCDELSEGSGRMTDRRATRGHLVSREGVLLLAQESPALLHFWYSELSPQQAALADSIIDSFR